MDIMVTCSGMLVLLLLFGVLCKTFCVFNVVSQVNSAILSYCYAMHLTIVEDHPHDQGLRVTILEGGEPVGGGHHVDDLGLLVGVDEVLLGDGGRIDRP